jgi:DNA repair exonuclease SbcCD nuclease subunit
MKIALITDQHFGVKNDSPIFLEYQKKFYEKTFFPYLKKHNITEVVDLGDTFDRRKYINYNTLAEVKDFYFDKLREENITLHIIVGNHSTFHKNKNDINSPDLLLREYSNIINYAEPKHVMFGNCNVLMMPWINTENLDTCFDTIKNTDVQVMFGHFELSDETLRRNFKFHNGITLKTMKKFEHVFSGHYHQKITKGNFKYLGVPYQLTWEDVEAEKGFHIFDTDTRTIKFIPNPHKIYKKILWEESGQYNVKELMDNVAKDADKYANKYIKVIVRRKDNPYILDRYIEAIEQCAPHSVTTEESIIIVNGVEESDSIEKIEDTLTTLVTYINSMESLEKRDSLLYFVETLYQEALAVEEL